jgi:hypothetical protein
MWRIEADRQHHTEQFDRKLETRAAERAVKAADPAGALGAG